LFQAALKAAIRKTGAVMFCNLQQQADELHKWGVEIDELNAKSYKTKTETRSKLHKQMDELRVRTETARDNLIKVFLSIRNKDQSG
jgi:septal ring factor EnvC (AmiA/AmiB activator)